MARKAPANACTSTGIEDSDPSRSASSPKADIDFENELWDVANELRGDVAENQYKDYVLSSGRYVDSEAAETDGVPFEEKMLQITAQMAVHFGESAVLERKIREN